ncbi:hypothetical protein FDA94_13730 [Herbidospora galbida]|uniref:CATRA-Associated Small Protein domain-containing protein n=1 Tax=Herbidospora galbida TaxID=2575442 RepID=A0A4U3MI81_9ACTN|nr:CATRA system-associated protein [Herbidospora galbida]TKK88359.1 hypothetical protein FDA94_13730 [Herbidospora galbida]
MSDGLDDLRKLLAEIPTLRLKETVWKDVAELLADADDPGEIQGVAGGLRMVIDSKRISRIGDPPVVPAPPVVRERLARLVMRIGGPEDLRDPEDGPV